MEEDPVNYACVNDPITSGSPAVVGQKERALTAVNRLDCAAYELYDPLTLRYSVGIAFWLLLFLEY